MNRSANDRVRVLLNPGERVVAITANVHEGLGSCHKYFSVYVCDESWQAREILIVQENFNWGLNMLHGILSYTGGLALGCLDIKRKKGRLK